MSRKLSWINGSIKAPRWQQLTEMKAPASREPIRESIDFIIVAVFWQLGKEQTKLQKAQTFSIVDPVGLREI